MPDNNKKHTVTDIIRDAVTKYDIGKVKSVLLLVPKGDKEDVILVAKDITMKVYMYSIPSLLENQLVSDLYLPIIINMNQILNDVPTDVQIKDRTAVIQFQDGSKATVSINREPTESAIKEATAAINIIPETPDSKMEITPTLMHLNTDSIASYNGKVVLGNTSIKLIYSSDETKEVMIKSRAVMDEIKSIARKTNSNVGISTSGSNLIISTNLDSDTTDKDIDLGLWSVCTNLAENQGRTAKETVETIEEILNSDIIDPIIKCVTDDDTNSGFVKLVPGIKSVLSKYKRGISSKANISISKSIIEISISDNQMDVRNEVDISDIESAVAKNLDYPYDMSIRIEILGYICGMRGNIKAIKAIHSEERSVIIVETTEETATFAI